MEKNILQEPIFNNEPNQLIQQDGRDHWISRSVAVVGVMCIIKNRKPYFLAEKRSKNMDSSGLWCVPCGYMDWKEDGIECLTREIYEETTIFLDDLKSDLIFIDKQPFFVKTDPGEIRQNIVLSYSLAIMNNNIVEDVTKVQNDEIDEIRIISFNNLDQYKWAFNHDERIIHALHHLNYVLPEKILKK